MFRDVFLVFAALLVSSGESPAATAHQGNLLAERLTRAQLTIDRLFTLAREQNGTTSVQPKSESHLTQLHSNKRNVTGDENNPTREEHKPSDDGINSSPRGADSTNSQKWANWHNWQNWQNHRSGR